MKRIAIEDNDNMTMVDFCNKIEASVADDTVADWPDETETVIVDVIVRGFGPDEENSIVVLDIGTTVEEGIG